MLPNDLHYHFPLAIWLLLFAPVILVLFLNLRNYRKKVLENFANKEIYQNILVARSNYSFWLKALCLFLSWILATVALMQPQGGGHYPLETAMEKAKEDLRKKTLVKKKAHDVIFLIDASKSMDVLDTRVGLSRLEYAKEIVDEVIAKLRGENVALYAFTSDTTKLAPPTTDYLFARLVLNQISINEGDIAGTDVFEALADMHQEYLLTLTPKLKTLVVLTDGGDTQLEGLSRERHERQMQSILNLFDHAKERGLRVFTIGMGTEQGKKVPGIEYEGKPVISTLNEEILKRLSQKARGTYYFANQWSSYDLANDLVEKILSVESPLEAYQTRSPVARVFGEDAIVYDLFFQIPLGLALFFLIFAIYFPDTTKLIKLPLILFALFFPITEIVGAEEDISLEKRGNAYFEAKDYEKAKEIFQELDMQKLSTWQKRRLIYNIGTIDLARGDFSSAMQEFSKISPLPQKAYLLKRALQTNQAALAYRSGKELTGGKPEIDNLRKAIFLFFSSLGNIAAADLADCELAKFLGSERKCTLPLDLKVLKDAVKTELALTLKQFEKLKIAEASPKTALPLLASGIRSALKFLEFLQKLDEKVKRDYLTFFTNTLQTYLPLWVAQVEKTAELKTAYENFEQGLKNMKQEEYAASRLAFLESQSAITALTKQLFGKDPLLQLLQDLLTQYESALAEISQAVATLNRIEIEQNQVIRVADATAKPAEKLHIAKRFLTKSLQYAREAKPAMARIYLALASHEIRLMLRNLMKKALGVDAILEDAIEDQNQALSLNRLKQLIGKENTLFPFLMQAQKQVLQTAQPFLENVAALQKKGFFEKCQCKPWDEVIPLFDKGKQAATDALMFIENLQMRLAMQKQEEAVKFFKAALEKLRAVEKEPRQPEKTKESVKEVLQRLQKMYKQDREKTPKDVPLQKGLRPW